MTEAVLTAERDGRYIKGSVKEDPIYEEENRTLDRLINRSFFITPQQNVRRMLKQVRAGLYLRVSTEGQELGNQRAEIAPFIERRGWKLECSFEDVVSGGKREMDRPGFAAMLKGAHQRKFDVLVFWALDRLTREGTRATLNYLQRLESKGVDYVSFQEQWLDSTGPFKDVMIAMFATLAKQERARISERTIAGLKVARAKGKRLGRPRLPEETVRAVLSLNRDLGIGTRKIAKSTGFPLGTVSAILINVLRVRGYPMIPRISSSRMIR
jgi:DNA invertase Pin-like site-specific DNA recombinase